MQTVQKTLFIPELLVTLVCSLWSSYLYINRGSTDRHMLLTPLKRPRVTPLPSQDAPLAQDQELRIKERTPPTTPPLPTPPPPAKLTSDSFRPLFCKSVGEE